MIKIINAMPFEYPHLALDLFSLPPSKRRAIFSPPAAPAKEIGARVFFFFLQKYNSRRVSIYANQRVTWKRFPSSHSLHESSAGPDPCIARVSDHSAKEGNYEWIIRERERNHFGARWPLD